MAKKLTLNVNGRVRSVAATPDTPLLYVLRDQLGLDGPMFGCGLAQCGACSVLANGKEIRSCVSPVAGVVGKELTTLEGLPQLYAKQKGLAKAPELHPVQQAWIDEQVPQCGYCQAGMMVTAAGLLMKTARPTTAQIRKGMNGHLCRCGTQTRIISAISKASKAMA
jgi:aerobic-type carbon monoxide dehydrogenase small subunit (CoxS/CutS family)